MSRPSRVDPSRVDPPRADPSGAAPRRDPQDRLRTLTAVGVALTAAGVLAALVTVVPLFTGSQPLPVAFYLASMLAPLGLAVVLAGVLLTALHRSRATRRAAAAGPVRPGRRPGTTGSSRRR